MKIAHINTNNISQLFKSLEENLGGELTIKAQEHVLSLDNDLVEGVIKGVTFDNFISFMEYDVTFKQDTYVVNQKSTKNPINFMYCAKGNMAHSFGVNGTKSSLNKYQTGIFSGDPSRDNSIFFRKDQEVKLFNIMVDTGYEDNSEDLLQRKLIQNFMPKGGQETFAYTGSYNLKIAERIQQIEAVTQKGIVRNLLIKGIVHVILALEIQQHKEDAMHGKNAFGSLNRAEMDAVKELSDFIVNYPEIEYSLKYLSNKSGLSPAKLQEGFKLLHNRTVTDYIRNVRVETAENLIKTTDLNISEIVYSVGLTSRSYFSKIFKEKYNCSPKYYQDHQNTLAETA